MAPRHTVANTPEERRPVKTIDDCLTCGQPYDKGSVIEEGRGVTTIYTHGCPLQPPETRWDAEVRLEGSAIGYPTRREAVRNAVHLARLVREDTQ